MVSFPNAKINLGLHILHKRADGYHDLETCMLPVGWCDALEFVEASKIKFSTSGLEIPGSGDDNLVMRAYQIMRKDFALPPLHVHLHKVIPFGAGLGGGSADAAFMLRMLSEYFDLFLEDTMLEIYASTLGSDCAFFVKNEPALARGRGDELSPIDLNLKGLYILLIFPGFAIGTAQAYKGVNPSVPKKSLEEILQSPVTEWKEQLHNQFEDTVFPAYPVLADIKSELYRDGAIYASMSGSGSAMYGLFSSLPDKTKWEQKGYNCFSGAL